MDEPQPVESQPGESRPGGFRVWWEVLRAQVRSQTQYRASFAVDLLFSTLLSTLDVVTVFVLLSVSGALGGFGWQPVLLVAGLASLSFTLADAVVGGTETLRNLVRSGEFDSLLLRPLSSLGQLAVGAFAMRRVGRVAQGLAVYVVALVLADVPWDPWRALYAVVAPLAGAVLFGSLFVAGACLAFWWVESGEVANSVTYGGRDFTSYPMTLFDGWFGRAMAFGFGLAFVSYLPALALLDLPDPLGVPQWLRWCSPLAALVAALAARSAWRSGIRHYRSTGS